MSTNGNPTPNPRPNQRTAFGFWPRNGLSRFWAVESRWGDRSASLIGDDLMLEGCYVTIFLSNSRAFELTILELFLKIPDIEDILGGTDFELGSYSTYSKVRKARTGRDVTCWAISGEIHTHSSFRTSKLRCADVCFKLKACSLPIHCIQYLQTQARRCYCLSTGYPPFDRELMCFGASHLNLVWSLVELHTSATARIEAGKSIGRLVGVNLIRTVKFLNFLSHLSCFSLL